MSEKILLVEDNAGLRKMLKTSLEKEGFQVSDVEDGESAVNRINRNNFEIVITDLKLPRKSGMEVLKAALENDPLTTVIIMTAYGSIEDAVSAVKIGAFDFITKPFDTDFLLVIIRRGLEKYKLVRENILLREELPDGFLTPKIIGKSPKFVQVSDELKRVGPSDATVLLLGESGTGKELLARAIHQLSDRRDYPFVAINCAAIPDTLLENELFGHEKGAYTGAVSKKIGKFELADKGAIFLDEIGDLSRFLQAKLLRVLQERAFERIGGTKTIHTDVRIIAATNQDLKQLVRTKAFRDDLYYRLSVFPIEIPPLRERKEDIPILAEHFIQLFAADLKKPKSDITDDAIKKLMDHYWPGNVRELQNCIERALILAEDGIVRPENLGFSHISENESFGLDQFIVEGDLQQSGQNAKNAVEKELIRRTLEATKGNKSETARRLNINYKTLLMKIKEFGLER